MPATRILLVDDEAAILMTLAANLDLAGFEVVEAMNGAQAFEIAREQRFDLVISDIRMPKMNGVELFQQLRKLRPGLPVILMTGFAVEGDVKKALSQGVYAVLPKPFDVDKLVRTAERAIARPAVLVVDDPRTAAEIVNGAGLRVKAVGSAAAAIEALEAAEADVCVAVIAESGDDHVALAGVERILDAHPEVALVVVSRPLSADVATRLAGLGVCMFLERPVATPDIVEVIARLRGKAALQ